MPSSSIPVIDISSIVPSGNPSQTLIAKWDTAMRSVGFSIIVGHGMEPAIVNELYAKAKQFFASTIEEKLKYRKDQFYGSGGYTPIGMEAASRSIQDRHEANVSHRIYMPDCNDWLPPELKSPVDAYCQEMAKLLAIIHRLSANALGLPENFFDELYKEPINSLKLSNYLSPLAEMDKDANATSANAPLLYGAHKDILGLTILRHDNTMPGLEVWLDGPRQWVPVPHGVANSFVVNVGDIVEHWTNGLWKSPLHRVAYYTMPMSPQMAHYSRLSMVYFTGPSPQTQIAPLPSCVEMTGGKPLYPSFTPQEYRRR